MMWNFASFCGLSLWVHCKCVCNVECIICCMCVWLRWHQQAHHIYCVATQSKQLKSISISHVSLSMVFFGTSSIYVCTPDTPTLSQMCYLISWKRGRFAEKVVTAVRNSGLCHQIHRNTHAHTPNMLFRKWIFDEQPRKMINKMKQDWRKREYEKKHAQNKYFCGWLVVCVSTVSIYVRIYG